MSVTPFPTRLVERCSGEAMEDMGTKRKYWFRDGDRTYLYKADDRDTGEDWAEVVACNLCALIGLPHINYTLAMEDDGSDCRRPGVVCENFAPIPTSLVLGNQLLMSVDP